MFSNSLPSLSLSLSLSPFQHTLTSFHWLGERGHGKITNYVKLCWAPSLPGNGTSITLKCCVLPPKKLRKIKRKSCGFSAHLFQQINLSYWGLIWGAIYFTQKELLLSNFPCWHLSRVCVCVCVCVCVFLSRAFHAFSPKHAHFPTGRAATPTWCKFPQMLFSALLLLQITVGFCIRWSTMSGYAKLR